MKTKESCIIVWIFFILVLLGNASEYVFSLMPPSVEDPTVAEFSTLGSFLGGVMCLGFVFWGIVTVAWIDTREWNAYAVVAGGIVCAFVMMALFLGLNDFMRVHGYSPMLGSHVVLICGLVLFSVAVVIFKLGERDDDV